MVRRITTVYWGWLAAAAVIGLLWLGCPRNAAADEMERLMKGGLGELAAGEFEKAWDRFEAALDEVEDRQSRAQLYFYLGLTRHRQASKLPELNDEAKQWLESSVGYYTQALRINPTSSGASNNLAQVYAMLDADERAEHYYRQAIDLGGRHQVTYITNYADFLYETGEPDEAGKYYGLALQREPGSRRAQAGFERYYREQRPAEYGAYLGRLIDSGRPKQTLQAALAAIQQDGWQDQQHVEFMSYVARCLSLLNLDTGQLPPELTPIRNHQVVGKAAGEIRLLYSGVTFDPDDYPWWRKQVSRVEKNVKPPRGGWPQEAFTALINARGDHFQRRGETETSERHYKLAYGLTGHHIDPQALIKLADMWVKNDQQDKLNEFLGQQEERLFDQKSGAIRAMHHKRTYELHRSLAQVYVHLDRWDDPTGYRNAKFQLQAAMDDARRHNEQAQAQGSDDLIVDAQLVGKLSNWYLRNNKKAEDYTLRVREAQYLYSLGADSAAGDVIEPLDGERAPAGVVKDVEDKYNELKNSFKQPRGGMPDLTRGKWGSQVDPDSLVFRLDGSNVKQGSRNDPSNWKTFEIAGRLELWYPGDAGMSRSQIQQWSKLVEKLIAKGLADREGKQTQNPRLQSQSPQARLTLSGGKRTERAPELLLLPEGPPRSILGLDYSDGQGKLMIEFQGQKLVLPYRADAANATGAFQYVQ